MPSQVVLFRRDLRVSDHAALSGAMRAGITLGLIVLDPEILGATQFGMPRYSGHRVRFLLESIVSLRVALVELGVSLKVFVGSTCGALKEVFDEFPIAAIHIHDEPGTEEAAELLAIQRLARSGGVQVRTYKGDTLLSEADLPYPVTRLPEMFTTFRKDVERRWDIKPLIPIPSAQELPNIANLGDIPALESFGFTEPSVQRFKGGLYEARKRLQHYFWDADKLQYYKETRNGMLQDDDSSKLSPWLAVGAISAREIYYEVRKYEKERVENDSTYWMIFELLWRDYFHFHARKVKSQLFQIGGTQNLKVAWKSDMKLFKAWSQGQTGYPLVDAGMRELIATGYLSNRSRQIVASFACNALGLDWRLGAAWFESQLLDYDMASNWGNWQYLAGVGQDAREFRVFSLSKQAQNYDPKGKFQRHWVPEAFDSRKSNYPAPIVHFESAVNERRKIFERAR